MKTSIIKFTKQTEGEIVEKLKELEISMHRNKIGKGGNNLVFIFKDNIEINIITFQWFKILLLKLSVLRAIWE